MNAREMFKQTTLNDKRQTNPQTQTRQLNKQIVKSAGRRSLLKLQKAVYPETATMLIARRLNIQPTNLKRNLIHSLSLPILSEISQTECVRERQNFGKEILKIVLV